MSNFKTNTNGTCQTHFHLIDVSFPVLPSSINATESSLMDTGRKVMCLEKHISLCSNTRENYNYC